MRTIPHFCEILPRIQNSTSSISKFFLGKPPRKVQSPIVQIAQKLWQEECNIRLDIELPKIPTKNPGRPCDIPGFSSRQKQTASCKHRRFQREPPLRGSKSLMAAIMVVSSPRAQIALVNELYTQSDPDVVQWERISKRSDGFYRIKPNCLRN